MWSDDFVFVRCLKVLDLIERSRSERQSAKVAATKDGVQASRPRDFYVRF